MSTFNSTTFAAVAELLVNRIAVPVEIVKPQARIGADLGLRDDAFTSFMMAVEDRFNISIDDDGWREINTLADLVLAVDQAVLHDVMAGEGVS